VAALKRQNVSRIRDLKVLLAEVQCCQSRCPFCHHTKTFFMRDMISWSYLPYAQDVVEGAAAAEQDVGEGGAVAKKNVIRGTILSGSK
jgi:hypothetical protein